MLQKWEDNYQELVDMYERYGIQYYEALADNPPLALWLRDQQTCALRRKKITQERTDLLVKINAFDNLEDSDQPPWDDRYREVKENQEKKEEADYEPLKPKLRRWLQRQKALAENGLVSKEKADLLEKLD